MGITRRLLLTSVVGAIASLPMLVVRSPIVQAQSAWSIPARQAQGHFGPAPVLMIHPGWGLNLSLVGTGETIKKAWLEDPSKITIDADGTLCPAVSGETEGCTENGAKVLHLKQIKPLKFPQLPASPEGTLLSLVAEATNGSREIYHFQIKYGQGDPQYHTVRIVPDPAPLTVIKPENIENALLVDVQRGLAIAIEQNQVQEQGPLYQGVQKFISLARSGSSPEAAAQKAGVKMAVIDKLAQMGRQPPQASSPVAPTKNLNNP